MARAVNSPGKPDAGNPPVRFDEGRELPDLPRSAPAYSTPPVAPLLQSARGLRQGSPYISTINSRSLAAFSSERASIFFVKRSVLTVRI